jgi:hypothetical protein
LADPFFYQQWFVGFPIRSGTTGVCATMRTSLGQPMNSPDCHPCIEVNTIFGQPQKPKRIWLILPVIRRFEPGWTQRWFGR